MVMQKTDKHHFLLLGLGNFTHKSAGEPFVQGQQN
jgi:hypothetical protein